MKRANPSPLKEDILSDDDDDDEDDDLQMDGKFLGKNVSKRDNELHEKKLKQIKDYSDKLAEKID